MAGQQANQVFLSEHHAAVVTKTIATITQLGKTININSWGPTAPFPCEMMRSAPDTSFDERGNAGGKPSYQWYTKIKVACQNFRKAPHRLAAMQRRARLGIPIKSLRICPDESNCSTQPRTSRDHRNRRPEACRRWNRPNLQVPTPLDRGEDETSSTPCRFDPWSY